MINAGLVQNAIAATGVPVTSVSVGWGGSQSEGPTYSYHTYNADGTLIRLIWSVAWDQNQWNTADAAIQAYSEASALITQQQQVAIAALSDTQPLSRLQRGAIVSLITNLVQALNTERSAINACNAWIASFQTQLAAATSLADFKTRMAGVATPTNVSTLTAQAAINAVKADIPTQIGGNV